MYDKIGSHLETGGLASVCHRLSGMRTAKVRGRGCLGVQTGELATSVVRWAGVWMEYGVQRAGWRGDGKRYGTTGTSCMYREREGGGRTSGSSKAVSGPCARRKATAGKRSANEEDNAPRWRKIDIRCTLKTG